MTYTQDNNDSSVPRRRPADTLYPNNTRIMVCTVCRREVQVSGLLYQPKVNVANRAKTFVCYHHKVSQ